MILRSTRPNMMAGIEIDRFSVGIGRIISGMVGWCSVEHAA